MAKRSKKKAYRMKVADKRFLERAQSIYDQLVPRAVQQLPTMRLDRQAQHVTRPHTLPVLVHTIARAQAAPCIATVRAYILDNESPEALLVVRDGFDAVRFAVRRREFPIEEVSGDDLRCLIDLLIWYAGQFPEEPAPPRNHGPLANQQTRVA